MQVWDLITDTNTTQRTTWIDLDHAVVCVAYSPHGTHVLSSDGHEIRYWEVSTGTSVVWAGGAHSLAFSPDGTEVLSGHDTLRIWNTKTGEHEVLSGGGDVIFSVAFSADGTRAISGSGDGMVRLWDLRTRTFVQWTGHTAAVYSVAFSPSGTQALSGAADAAVRLWDVEAAATWCTDGTQNFDETGVDCGGACSACAPSCADGTQNGDESGADCGGSCAAVCATCRDGRLNGDEAGVDCGGSCAACGSSVVWSGHTGIVRAVAFSQDGAEALSGSDDKTVRLWNVSGGTSVVWTGSRSEVRFVSFLPGRSPRAFSWDRSNMREWYPASAQSSPLPLGQDGFWMPEICFACVQVSAVAVSVEKDLLLVGREDHRLRLYRLSSGSEVAQWDARDGIVTSVALSPGASKALSGAESGTVRLWDVAGGTSEEWRGHTGAVVTVAFSRDGKLALSGSEDTAVRLWNVSTGSFVVWSGHAGSVRCVAFAPNGRQALSASWDWSLRYWDVETGTSVAWYGHGMGVEWVAFSDDGTKALSGSQDHTVRLWDVPRGPSCADGAQNGDEVWVDCGGSCAACTACTDGVLNGDEAGVDCGGSCPACGGHVFCDFSGVERGTRFCGGLWTTEPDPGRPQWVQVAGGGTPTPGTGPPSGPYAHGGAYVYTRVNRHYGRSVRLTSRQGLYSGVRFSYHMYGATMGSLAVWVLMQRGDWAEVFRREAAQQRSRGESWRSETVAFAGLAKRVRFVGVTGEGDLSEAAISNVVLFGPRASPAAHMKDLQCDLSVATGTTTFCRGLWRAAGGDVLWQRVGPGATSGPPVGGSRGPYLAVNASAAPGPQSTAYLVSEVGVYAGIHFRYRAGPGALAVEVQAGADRAWGEVWRRMGAWPHGPRQGWVRQRVAFLGLGTRVRFTAVTSAGPGGGAGRLGPGVATGGGQGGLPCGGGQPPWASGAGLPPQGQAPPRGSGGTKPAAGPCDGPGRVPHGVSGGWPGVRRGPEHVWAVGAGGRRAAAHPAPAGAAERGARDGRGGRGGRHRGAGG